jgi:broad specificity phosphatase PhoE
VPDAVPVVFIVDDDLSIREALESLIRYWQRCDTEYVDGPDAESFRAFTDRLCAFHRQLLARDSSFVIAVGHGQFFRAYRMALHEGFAATAEWMKRYRLAETSRPMANGEVIELDRDTIAAFATDIRECEP